MGLSRGAPSLDEVRWSHGSVVSSSMPCGYFFHGVVAGHVGDGGVYEVEPRLGCCGGCGDPWIEGVDSLDDGLRFLPIHYSSPIVYVRLL